MLEMILRSKNIHFLKPLVLVFFLFGSGCDEPPRDINTVRVWETDSADSLILALAKRHGYLESLTDTCLSCILDTAVSLQLEDQWEEAMIHYFRYLDMDSTNWVVYANRASCFYNLLYYENALEDYLKAHELNPIFDNQISHMYFATGREEIACAYYWQAMAKGDTTFNWGITKYCGKKQRPN